MLNRISTLAVYIFSERERYIQNRMIIQNENRKRNNFFQEGQ